MDDAIESLVRSPGRRSASRAREPIGRRSEFVRRLTRLAGLLLALLVIPLVSGCTQPSWKAEYFDNPTLSGAPVLEREDPAIDFDWGQGSPDTAVPADGFSVRWRRLMDFEAGTYRFTTATDDGVRLIIDDQVVLDQWQNQSLTQREVEVPLSAGQHSIVMEYFEADGDAAAQLHFGVVDPPASPTDVWSAEYFGNTTLGGTPLMERGDAEIDFDWGQGAPGFGMPADDFSVRWTRTLDLSAGTWHFVTYNDDGIRVYVDGVLVIDDWNPHPVAVNETDVTLGAGEHEVVVEYFEAFGDAVVRVNWARKVDDGSIRVNTGGGDYSDAFHQYWDPDAFATGGLTSEEAQPIWNTEDDQLYVNERAGAFSYDIPVADGDYVVRLHFAELFFSSAGVRRFDVAIEGAPVLSSFDIYATAGKGTLVTRSFPATVTDGVLDIEFSKVFDNASVQAIDVYPASEGVDLDAPVFAAVPEPENATHTTSPTLTLDVTDDVELQDGYWRVDEQEPLPLFEDAGSAAYSHQFTMPVETFNELSLGSHTFTIMANDTSGNASTVRWRFRKLASGSGSVPIAFDRRPLLTAATPGAETLKHPTTLQFGPDGRLYVGQQDGYIFALTLDGDRNVTDVERIDTIHDTPTPNADGSPGPTSKRHLIGIDFDPASTPEQPILWAVHSDYRFCFNKTPETCDVNPDSGILTRLAGPDFDDPANRSDVVSGLPRSRENHAPNAVHFGPDGWLYMTIGSNTNYGAPSTAFSFLPERYLTAAVVRFNVNGASASFPLDLRDVTSAADLQPGVVELYATGYRNAFDFLWHGNGQMYVNVNAGNFTAGPTPGPADGCPDTESFDPGTRSDFLAIVDAGDHGGAPNPARGQCVLDDGAVYTPPRTPDANYRAPILYYSNGTSSDGMAEYDVPTFGGQMLGNIISATYSGNQSVRRVVLANDGQSVLFEEDLAIFNQPLDVAVGSEGSIYVAEHGGSTIQILEPAPSLEGTWDFKADLPVPTQEVGVVACAGRIYVLGGLVGPATDTADVWAYDPVTDRWTTAAPYPGAPVDHMGAACVDGTVYAIGGLVAAGPPVTAVWAYDPLTDAWTSKADLPTARGAMGVATLDGKIYIAGGLGYPAKNDLTAYDPATDSWQTLAPMPTARDHLIMEAVDGKLFAVGGRDVTVDSPVAVNEVYDPATDTWATRAPMPVERAAMASADLGGRIQVWGGEGPSGTPTGTYGQGDQYDPVTNRWVPIAGEPTPRHGTDGARIGDVVYVPGGGPQTGASVTAVHEAFSFISTDPPTSCVEEGTDPRTTDSDGDGYTDQDEIDNGSEVCSAASVPPDFDGDLVSDLNDPDDDDDGVLDVDDQFQLDPTNGTTTVLPWTQDWDPGTGPWGLFGNSGFPGVQLTSNGDGFIAPRVHAGGAGGFLSIDATAGTAVGSTNSQDNALQVGFDATSPVTIEARIGDPMNGLVLEPGKAGGIFFGLDEDDYTRLVIDTDGPGGATRLSLGVEADGTFVQDAVPAVPIDTTGLSTLDLFLDLDPASGQITARYRLDSDAAGDIAVLGTVDATSFPGLVDLFRVGAAAGPMATNAAPSPFGLGYEQFSIQPVSPLAPPVAVTDAGSGEGAPLSASTVPLGAAALGLVALEGRRVGTRRPSGRRTGSSSSGRPPGRAGCPCAPVARPRCR